MLEKLAVIGCGTMGYSITLCAAWAGINVKMQGINDADIDRGLSNIDGKLKVLVKNGIVSEAEVETITERISVTTSLEEAVNETTFIIEAVPEDLNLKRDLFKRLDGLCEKDVILASNTSGLSPSEIAEETSFPERTVVTHFWNPAHLVHLVEVVRGEKTNDSTVKRSMDLMIQMRKKPIEVKKESLGFVGNRLQYALFREAQFILEEGIASKEDIDAAVTYGIGRRLPVTGPLASADMGGLDVFSAISNYLFEDLCNADKSLPILEQLVKDGRLGDKTGAGFYSWDATFSKKMNHKREQELIHYLKQDLELEN
ncbi:3-hydroxyacyl-CoA dehydrogenase family protein [Metabacillus herbersteinensis]|uniref:3-hydroxyacyl-CoA dehydrogenase family protein n=1 Tax=Metabacillus herbersteinensis TaxID=283816 RepID=A0ABV6GAN6_9BACI